VHAIDDQVHVIVIRISVDRPDGLTLSESECLHDVPTRMLCLADRWIFALHPIDGHVIDRIPTKASPTLALTNLGVEYLSQILRVPPWIFRRGPERLLPEMKVPRLGRRLGR
jgi:hypothetical protein